MIRNQNESIVKTFVPSAPVRMERDTLYMYVDADTSGYVSPEMQGFSTSIFISDIGPEDTAFVRLNSITHNNVLISNEIASVHKRKGYGQLADRTIRFPVFARFPKTGLYSLNFEVKTKRVHFVSDSVLLYNNTQFPSSLLPKTVLDNIENTSATMTVVVEDTSKRTFYSGGRLSLSVGRKMIETAIGYPETNTIIVSQAMYEPKLRIIRGSGILKQLKQTTREAYYQWHGTPQKSLDSIVIEGNVSRSAGGKDIARASFIIRAKEPFLKVSFPSVAYAGEDLSCNLKVTGLENDELYQWVVSEITGGEIAKKDSGRGPILSYHIPGHFAGKTLRIDASYMDHQYRYISSESYQSGISEFEIPVILPPTRITFSLPDRVTASHVFKFEASMYNDPRFKKDQPVGNLRDVNVTLVKENETVIRTDVTMVSKGKFQFVVESKNIVSQKGEKVTLKISAKEASISRTFMMYRN